MADCDGSEVPGKSQGGHSMSFDGPHPATEEYGWDDPANTSKFEPATNHNSATNYLYADGRVETINDPWPWSDSEGTDFYPSGDITINP